MRKSLIQHTTSRETTNQLLDYYLIPELTNGIQRGFAKRIKGELCNHNVIVTEQKIYTRAQKVMSGEGILHPAAEFHNIPGQREGKDLNYAGFWTMVDLFLPDKNRRSYIGLAGNQIDIIRSRVNNSITVCEKDSNTSWKLARLAQFIKKTKGQIPRIRIIHNDIFEFLKENNDKFNIFDLDLMQSLCPNKIPVWVKLIRKAQNKGDISAVNLSTTIGRSCTEEEYNKRVEKFCEALEQNGLRELGYSRFAYRDRIIPMRSERFILKCR